MDLGFVSLIYSGYPGISQIVVFVRTHPNLVFLLHKGKSFKLPRATVDKPPLLILSEAAVNWTPLDSNRQDNRTNMDP